VGGDSGRIPKGLGYLIQVCEEGTKECIGVLLELWETLVRSFGSFFGPSGKDRGLEGFEL